MSLFYNNNAGLLLPISGLNGQSGELVIGTTDVRTGTCTIPPITPTSTDPWEIETVTFSTPMPDTNYMVDYQLTGSYWNNVMIYVGEKRTTGFDLNISVTSGGIIPQNTLIVKWKAFQVHTATDVVTLQNKVNGSVTFTAVPPFCVTKNNFSVTVSTLDGVLIQDVPLTAATWKTNVRNLGVISSNVSSPTFVMTPCSYQTENAWISGCARIYYSGRIDLWCPESLSAYVPYFNCTLPIP